jgi:hypothetical protein
MEIAKENNPYSGLKSQISELLLLGREQAGRVVNSILVQTYWQIGRHIVEFEQGGNEKSEYGSELLDRLSRDLSMEFGKGFSRTNLFQIRQFYYKFPKIQTLSGQLSWSHYVEIIKADQELEIGFSNNFPFDFAQGLSLDFKSGEMEGSRNLIMQIYHD